MDAIDQADAGEDARGRARGVLRLLLAQRLVDTEGLPGADRQGVYEPQEPAGSKVLAKLAKQVAPPRSDRKRLSRRVRMVCALSGGSFSKSR